MINKNIVYFVIISISSFVSSFTYASTNIPANDMTAEVVHLRTDCTGVTNCATTFEELLDWVWVTRNPTAASPLLIEIGPGTHIVGRYVGPPYEYFPLPLCEGGGNVTFRGSGTDETIVTGWGGGVLEIFPEGTVFTGLTTLRITDCDNLRFEDFTVSQEPFLEQAFERITVAITWEGGGNSVWSNMLVEGNDTRVWKDVCSTTNETGTHVWYGSKLRLFPTNAYRTVMYLSECGTTHFHDGVISAVLTGAGVGANELIAVQARHTTGVVNIYNSQVEAILTVDSSPSTSYGFGPGPVFHGHGGILATHGGTINMHGGTLAVRAEHATDSDVFGARAIDVTSTINTLDTAYDLLASGPSGISERIIFENGANNPIVLWPGDSAPPSIQTPNVFDLFAENDCDATGDCDGIGTETHLMIYDVSCGSDPWFNVLTDACRNI